MKQSNWSRSLTVLSLCAAVVAASVALKTASARSTELELLAAVKPTAVAIVEWERVVKASKEFTDGMGFLETQEKELQGKVDKLKGEFEAAKKTVENMKDAATPERLQATQDALVKEAQLTALAQTSQRILEVQGGTLMRKVFDNMLKACDKLQKQDGWDIVLFDDRKLMPPERFPDADGKEGARPTLRDVQQIIQRRHIATAVDRVDISQQVIEFMNAEYGKSPKK